MPVITQSKENSRARQSVRMLCEGAVMVALALVLNQLKIFRLPNGDGCMNTSKALSNFR